VTGATGPTGIGVTGPTGATGPTGTTVFGSDYQRQESLSESTTTSSTFQTKVTLTTGALTGTYRIGYGAKMKNNDDAGEARLYNSTDASQFGGVHGVRTKVLADEYQTISGVYEITLTGSSKTIVLQYRDKVGGNTQYIMDAWIEFWRVS
jgi:hypothetical protein